MRTAWQQSIIDRDRGYAAELRKLRMTAARKRTIAAELEADAIMLETEWPIEPAPLPLLGWPLEGGTERWPITRTAAEHITDGEEAAVDIACDIGVWVLAIHDCSADVVILDPSASPCGMQLDISWTTSGKEYRARYCHLGMIGAVAGHGYFKGDPIASSGNTGLSTGPHLHLALWVDGMRVDPEPYLVGA